MCVCAVFKFSNPCTFDYPPWNCPQAFTYLPLCVCVCDDKNTDFFPLQQFQLYTILCHRSESTISLLAFLMRSSFLRCFCISCLGLEWFSLFFVYVCGRGRSFPLRYLLPLFVSWPVGMHILTTSSFTIFCIFCFVRNNLFTVLVLLRRDARHPTTGILPHHLLPKKDSSHQSLVPSPYSEKDMPCLSSIFNYDQKICWYSLLRSMLSCHPAKGCV